MRGLILLSAACFAVFVHDAFAQVTKTVVLQNGLNNYAGCRDAYIEQSTEAKFGALATMHIKGG